MAKDNGGVKSPIARDPGADRLKRPLVIPC